MMDDESQDMDTRDNTIANMALVPEVVVGDEEHAASASASSRHVCFVEPEPPQTKDATTLTCNASMDPGPLPDNAASAVGTPSSQQQQQGEERAPKEPEEEPPLAHFSYSCPGLHDKGNRQSVFRCSFQSLFQDVIVIPLFQRAYCWNESVVAPFWRDTVKGATHSVGKAIYKRLDDTLWCLDGQQRATTVMLLVAAARDVLQHNFGHIAGAQDAVAALNSVLYSDVEAAAAAAVDSNTALVRGQRLECVRLVPSFVDRLAFYTLVLGREPCAVTRLSKQAATKHYFMDRFLELVRGRKPGKGIRAVVRRVESALAMQHMIVRLETRVNLAQVYQWLQEKSLFSAGALLYNPTPGLSMRASDLTRNLLLAPWMCESLRAQEVQHYAGWIEPFELRCGGDPDRMDQVLRRMVDHVDAPAGATEQRMAVTAQHPALASLDLSGMLLYLRVLSTHEFFERQLCSSEPLLNSNQRQRMVTTTMMDRIVHQLDAIDC